MILPRLRKLALASALALLTAACGGGGGDDVASGGIGGTGITSGSITGFGSIFVNGFELDLSGAAITIDDQAGSEGDLRLGMVVNAVVQYNDDGKTGSALAVEVEESLEGPITSVTLPVNGIRTAIILGVTVIISQDETVIDDSPDLSFDNINVGDVLEVYGFFNESDELEATRIEKKASGGGAGSEVEIKGSIKQLSSPTPPGTFKVRNLTVHFDSDTILGDIPGNMLADDLFVEVKGTLCDGTLCPDGDVNATKIEAKKPGDDIAKVSVEGIIASVDPSDAHLFVLNTAVGPIPVNAIGASFDPVGLVPVPGLEVEVEGTSVGGTLVAAMVKVDVQIRIEATVQLVSVSSGSVTLRLNDTTFLAQDLIVEVNESTKLIDQTGAVIPPSNLSLDDISPTDFLKIKALQRDDGKLVATQIRRTDFDDVVLQGPADVPPTGDPGPGGRVVSVLGVRFDTNGNTAYEGFDDNPIVDPNEFFNAVTPGSPVKMKDKAPTIDGVLEEAGFED